MEPRRGTDGCGCRGLSSGVVWVSGSAGRRRRSFAARTKRPCAASRTQHKSASQPPALSPRFTVSSLAERSRRRGADRTRDWAVSWAGVCSRVPGERSGMGWTPLAATNASSSPPSVRRGENAKLLCRVQDGVRVWYARHSELFSWTGVGSRVEVGLQQTTQGGQGRDDRAEGGGA